jgi:hypothetical protein
VLKNKELKIAPTSLSFSLARQELQQKELLLLEMIHYPVFAIHKAMLEVTTAVLRQLQC